MYCPDFLHAGDRIFSLSEMQSYWIDIFDKSRHKNLKYKISFTGGEVTINKDFLPFVKWLRENYKDYIHMILLTTNGSASVSYYTKLFNVVDNISFSFHGEHANEKLFFDKMVKLKKTISTKNFMHINIMNEHWIEDRIPLYTRILIKNHISHSINIIDYTVGTRMVPIMKGKANLEI
jgi:MoaA/NifB/PqqE/SkfB family radical SAM enzyme